MSEPIAEEYNGFIIRKVSPSGWLALPKEVIAYYHEQEDYEDDLLAKLNMRTLIDEEVEEKN